jgi:hypothetical protein
MTQKNEKLKGFKYNHPEEEGRIILSFILKTKNGDYAEIEESSLPYSRITQERESIEITDDEYYYSIS